MSGSVQHNAGPKPQKKLVYVSATDTVPDGAVLCYDTNAADNPSDSRLASGTLAIKPATAHLFAFAGIVVPGGGGASPGMFEIYIPRKGDVVEAFVGINTLKGATALGPVDGEYHLTTHADATLNEALSATAMLTDATLTATPAITKVYMR